MTKLTTLFTVVMLFAVMPVMSKTITLKITNPLSVEREAVPVVLPLTETYSSALVTINGTEIPCQLDDLDDDGIYDELCFLTDMKKKETQTITVTLETEGAPRQYPTRVYGSISVRDRSAKDPKHLPIRSITVPAESNPYQYVFPHGPLMESELVAFRIYADHRQSVDYYGHRVKQLELAETAFYPSKEQKEANYGDDVLYTGSTYGCGTLHGWNGTTSVMYDDVRNRTYTLRSEGPLRTVIETVNKAWRITKDSKPVDVRTRYILYAGHRDVLVDVKFSRPVGDLSLSTGVTDIIGSEKLSDNKGLLGCWGTALAGNNPKVYEDHTVGLAVCVPPSVFKGESYFSDTPKDKAGTMGPNGKLIMPNQAYVALLNVPTDNLQYWFTATCDLETYGFTDSKAWMSYLKQWKKELHSPVVVNIIK